MFKSSYSDENSNNFLFSSTPSSHFEDNGIRRHSFRKDYSSNSTRSHVNSLMNIEEEIRKSDVPIHSNESEEIEVMGYKGILLNRDEILDWNSKFPISPYKLNDDPSPEIIHKYLDQPIEYTQDVKVLYLKPPTPPPPGDIIIKLHDNSVNLSAPPFVIRQNPSRPKTPEPFYIREIPPEPPQPIPPQVINVNKREEITTRKVIVENLPSLPPKPQPIIIEKWLPYKKVPRKVTLITSYASESPQDLNETVLDEDIRLKNLKKLDLDEENLSDIFKDFDEKIQTAFEKIHEMIKDLRNELNEEKAKGKLIEEKLKTLQEV